MIQDIAQDTGLWSVISTMGCRNIQFDDCTWGMFCDKITVRQD
ncbi:MAG: hypothetical protein ACLVAS_11820 [Mediterraneibacter gnavus]